MRRISKNIFSIFFLFFVGILLVYWPLYFTFYQQDEWRGIGDMLVYGFKGFITSGFSPVQVFFGQSRILTAAINYFLFLAFPYNIFLLATYALLLHAINTTLVYVLASRIFKKIFIAVLCALFFCFNAVGSQAIIWFGTSVSALTATTFILISLIFLFKYVEKQKNNFLWFSYAALLVSLYFKESGLGLIPLFTLILFVTNRKKITWKFSLKALLPVIYFFSFAIFRYISTVFFSTNAVGYISSSSSLTTIPLNFIRALFTVSGQVLIPQNVALWMGDKIVPHIIPSFRGNELMIQSTGIDVLMIIISCALLIMLLLFNHKRKTLKQVVFFILLVIASILPYVLIAPGWSYFESRYYYVPIIGVSFLIGSFFLSIRKNKKLFMFSTITLAILLVLHISKILADLSEQKSLAQQRIALLNQIRQNIPSLHKKTLFYITGNQTYTVPNNPLPIQQGIGYTLQVWLFNNNNDKLKSFLTEGYLWDLGTQGYRQKGDQGFGYFYNFDEFKKTVQQYKIDQNNIYSFYWNGNTGSFTNTTNQIRENLNK